MSACAQSPSPTVEDLIEINPPSFSGQVNKNFTSPTRAFSISGTCDVKSRGLEYSLDSGPWQTLSGGCPESGQFTITGEADGYVTVAVRALKKFGMTSECRASVRWLQPPSTPALAAVGAGQSRHKLGEVSVPSALGLNFEGASSAAGPVKLHTETIGVVYGN